MDWFEGLFGFAETGYADTQRRLRVEGERLISEANGESFGIGRFAMTSLAALRAEVADGHGVEGRPRVRLVQGDVGRLHGEPEYVGALFQVASQFNALEMVGPSVTPEQGVTRYAHDRTQGPACAMAAAAALVYRNFFVPLPEGQIGQTKEHQLDGLAEVGTALGVALQLPVSSLWRMRNGYALCTPQGLAAIASHLDGISREARGALVSRLRIGLHRDVGVTNGAVPGQRVSQAFCSALPVSYGGGPRSAWQAFAQLVLDGAYEATLLAGVLNARRGASNIVLLTLLGGGAFGNDGAWIERAIRRALAAVDRYDLDLRLVSHGLPSSELKAFVGSLA